MGKTGHLGPAPEQLNKSGEAEVVPVSSTAGQLTGADLYRLNCRGCHGESGEGVPPEINSVINPVRATSTLVVLQRMKSTGMEISQAAASQMSREANAALLKRLREGGENMPPFSYLSEAEIAAIISYLKQLADVPHSSAKQIAVDESPQRIGELVVKSTCHICHDATGSNPGPQQMLMGAIPPIEVLLRRVDELGFVRKVTQGSVIVMGDDPIAYRGRMPVFYYLSQQEATDAYLYLHRYPPTESKKADFNLAAWQKQSGGTGDGSSRLGEGKAVSAPVLRLQSRDEAPLETILLPIGIYGFVILLLAGGMVFTCREFKRLCGNGANKNDRPSRAETHEPAGHLVSAESVYWKGRI
jgi:mono/diheme cytochrome c family protein